MNVKAEYDPTMIVIFMKIFGTEKNKPLLISFINSILEPKDHVQDIMIVDHEYCNPSAIFNLEAKDLKGEYFHIELDCPYATVEYNTEKFLSWAKKYEENLNKKNTAHKIIGIHFSNFNHLTSKKFHNVFRSDDIRSNVPFEYLSNDVQLHTIEIAKFKKEQERGGEKDIRPESQTILYIWMMFLCSHGGLKKADLTKFPDGHLIEQAMKDLEYISMNERELEIYDGQKKYHRDVLAHIDKHPTENNTKKGE